MVSAQNVSFLNTVSTVIFLGHINYAIYTYKIFLLLLTANSHASQIG